MQAGGPALGDIIGWIRDAGTIGVLAVILWGAGQEWWVTGVQYRRVLKEREAENERFRVERDEYKSELFNLLGLTDRVSRSLERATDRALLRDEQRIGRLEAQRDVRRTPED